MTINFFVDSAAIQALSLAFSLIDSNGKVPINEWVDACFETFGFSPELCQEYLNKFVGCKYAKIINEEKTKYIELAVRAVNEDSFYLQEAQSSKNDELINIGDKHFEDNSRRSCCNASFASDAPYSDSAASRNLKTISDRLNI